MYLKFLILIFATSSFAQTISIDAGTKDLYEQIRHSLTRESLFDQVIDNARNLIDVGVNVDFKCLINPFNDNLEAMDDLFALVRRVKGRKIYFRPVIVNNQAHVITEKTIAMLDELSRQHQTSYQLNTNKTLARNYKRCHQMFQFPVFCADGKMYVCCEGKGNPQFELASWDSGDFRDTWLSPRHYQIYNQTQVEFCQPCRPNINNIQIQNALNSPTIMESLFV
jgi:sulfatase maturation enzyme AslB (radical SAM superfamily)